MSETEIVAVGEELPILSAISAHQGHAVAVSWGNRDRPPTVVDLAPLIFRLKFYKPLRDDPALFSTVHLIEGGAAIAWGEHDDIDMDASSVERLAEEVMEAADFKAFMQRHKLTLDAAAAQLGISRRTAAYYAGGQRIPRTVVLACRYLDLVAGLGAPETRPSLAHGWPVSEEIARRMAVRSSEPSGAEPRLRAITPGSFEDLLVASGKQMSEHILAALKGVSSPSLGGIGTSLAAPYSIRGTDLVVMTQDALTVAMQTKTAPAEVQGSFGLKRRSRAGTKKVVPE